MSLIRALRPGGSHPTLARQTINHTQNPSLARNLENAKHINVRTLGRQSLLKVRDQADIQNASANSGSLRLKPTMLEHNSREEQAVESGAEVAECKRKESENQFFSTFKRTLNRETATSLEEKTGDTLGKIESNGGAAEPSQVLAAHTYNHAKQILQQEMPGASLEEVRGSAGNNPEIRDAVNLLDSSSTFLRESKNAQPERPARGETVNQEQRQLAEQAAANQKTWLQMSQVYTQICAERMKTARSDTRAGRHHFPTDIGNDDERISQPAEVGRQVSPEDGLSGERQLAPNLIVNVISC